MIYPIYFPAESLTSKITQGRLYKFTNSLKLDSLNSNIIVYARKLEVMDLMKLIECHFVVGIIVNKGSFAGHVAGFLNGRGVQFAISPDFSFTKSKNNLGIIDGDSKRIAIYPDKISIKKYKQIYNGEVLNTKDIKYTVNVDGKDENELRIGLLNGAAGIGILKTDWMDWKSSNPPSVETHTRLYKKCLEVVGDSRLNIRLFDIGGDKIPEWAKTVSSLIRSPIGYRGIRSISVLQKAYSHQVQAISEIALKSKIGVVLPMVTDVDEIITIKNEFKKILHGGFNNIVWGIMVEVPEAALNIKKLLQECDFVRIGPGDLSQGCLAMERENIGPNYYSRFTLSPGVCKLIKLTAKECKRQNKEITICQDVEPSLKLVRKIISLGIDNFCVSNSSVKTLLSYQQK